MFSRDRDKKPAVDGAENVPAGIEAVGLTSLTLERFEENLEWMGVNGEINLADKGSRPDGGAVCCSPWS